MSVSYKRLWKLLIDRDVSKPELRRRACISPNTFTKLNRDEMVAMDVLDRICEALTADYGDIVEHLSESEKKE